jgi:hypothetical protein
MYYNIKIPSTVWYFVLVSVVVVTTTIVFLTPHYLLPLALDPFNPLPIKNHNSLLGGEYYNIAVSLVMQEGYANPFFVPTGPTAWMPPLFPSFLAILLFFAKDKETTTTLLVIIKTLVIVASILWTFSSMERSKVPHAHFIGTLAGLSLLSIFFDYFFLVTNDEVILLPIVTAFLCLLQWVHNDDAASVVTTKQGVFLGLFIGLSLLASPIIGIAELITFLFVRSTRMSARHQSMIFLVAMLTITPWITRNYLVFDRFIPIKSNLSFDLAFANIDDDNGIYTTEDFSRHPLVMSIKHPEIFEERKWTSELAIVDEARERFSTYWKDNPYQIVRYIGNRLAAATFVFHPLYKGRPRRLEALQNILFSIPAVCIVFLLFRWRTLSSFQKSTLLFFVSAVAPYILVAFYYRYTVPLLPIYVLVVGWMYQKRRGNSLATS